MGHLTKILIANRGEISIRIGRTAHELGMQTVAIYSYEDRFGAHRYKADEAYQLGTTGQFTPVAAYLAIDEIVKIALEHDVAMIHPGYGLLSENASFARAVEAAGIQFIGPSPDVIDQLGDKTKARDVAVAAGVPVVPGTPGPIADYREADSFVAEHGFPVIIKAAMGGGGRGMRVVRKQDEFKDSFERAVSEAKNAFGDGTVFIERFLDHPRHIEVQLLGDHHGNVIHLFERDCSVQRRHQKVVEVAPAMNLDSKLRARIHADAVKIAKHVNYRNAGTAEFLVDQEGRHYFIEINPRIQVEHTITEEITGIDIIAAQIQVAAGVSLEQLGLTQKSVSARGFAIQCRITTEDPAKGFVPDTGKIEVYRSAGGNGIRLDASSGFAGAIITPHYDSLLVKVSASGQTYEVARKKMLRALVEFRIRGVKTNIPFLLRLLTHDVFVAGNTWTTFIDDTPSLFNLLQSQNRAQKLLAYLADVVVNGSSIKGQVGEPAYLEKLTIPTLKDRADPSKILNTSEPCQEGWRSILVQKGPEAFAKAVREYPGVLIMDTTWRDAHQSLLATRVRTIDLLNIAKETSYAMSNAFSLEMWGGATFDVAMRFLYEDPWERLSKLRRLVPNIPFQMLLRGANAVGYTSYPDNAVFDFCKRSVECGMDIFRIFDSLNYMPNLKLGIQAVKKAGGVAEGAISYTGDVSDPKKTKYTLDYYLNLTDELVAEGIHVLGIKDMAGLLKPEACKMLIGGIRKRHPDLVIHVHSHDTAGISAASMLACAAAGADVIDCCLDSMSGMTSQPAMGALVASLEQTTMGTGIRMEDVLALNTYWEQARLLYSCFDAGLKSSDASVYQHEMPGGQYSNLLYQSRELGLGTKWNEIKVAYAEANQLCGDIVKVTPSSKVVGDLAQFMVTNELSYQDVIDRADKLDFPASIVDFFQGGLGIPYQGFPEPLRTKIIRDRKRIEGRPGASMEPLDLRKIKADLREKYGRGITDYDVASYYMYPKVFEDFKEFQNKYGDLSVLPTQAFLSKPKMGEEMQMTIEEGKMLIVKLIAEGPLNVATGERTVIFELNGEARSVSVIDRDADVTVVHRDKAKDPEDVGAPMGGVVVEIRVKEGGNVSAGDPVGEYSLK